MPFFQGSRRARLHYDDTGGDGPVLVFGHGWALGADAWEYQMPALARRGFRCIAFDRRGCGRSEHTADGYDFDTFADDLAALLAHLDLHDVALVAHSMGAGEAVRLLSRHGTARVGRLALIAPITPMIGAATDNPDGIPAAAFAAMIDGLAADRTAWMNAGAELFFGRRTGAVPVADEVLGWGVGLIMRASATATVEMVRAWSQTDFRPDVAAVTVPTLVVHGDADEIAPLELTGRRTAAAIPEARLVVYPGGSHGLFVTHHTELNDELAAFAGSPLGTVGVSHLQPPSQPRSRKDPHDESHQQLPGADGQGRPGRSGLLL